MTREDAKKLLPIIAAFAEGKRIEMELGGAWTEIVDELSFAMKPECYRIAPQVGTAEWANSLPEGTRIRKPGWAAWRYWVRSGDQWRNADNMFCATVATLEETKAIDDWELYTPPAKKLRPWKPEEVPVGAQVRFDKDRAWVSVIVAVRDEKVWLGASANYATTQELADNGEHSLDGGKTWLPCGVEEAR